MTYAANEALRYAGKPVECYQFTFGGTVWRWTSGDRAVNLPMGTFDPEVISRDESRFSEEDTGERLDVTVARTNPVAALFIEQNQIAPVAFTLYRAFRGDEANYLTIFVGKITNARFEGSEVILSAAALGALLSRPVPTLTVSSTCQHAVYSAGCGADPLTHRDAITIGTVSGVTVTSTNFAARADGWFTGGKLIAPSGDARLIVAHVGDTVTLQSPLPGLASLDACYALWGCDRLESTCAAKFSNRVNFLGFSNLPTRNPYTQGIV